MLPKIQPTASTELYIALGSTVSTNNAAIDRACEKYNSLIATMFMASGIKELHANENPRCFLAIELEDKTSRKHRLGSMFNASVIGKIGIIVAADDKVYNSFVKIRRYFDFLSIAGKSSFNLRIC